MAWGEWDGSGEGFTFKIEMIAEPETVGALRAVMKMTVRQLSTEEKTEAEINLPIHLLLNSNFSIMGNC